MRARFLLAACVLVCGNPCVAQRILDVECVPHSTVHSARQAASLGDPILAHLSSVPAFHRTGKV